MKNNFIVPSVQREQLLNVLNNRFEKNMHRHKGMTWNEVTHRLETNNSALWSLQQMEQTGGEPDVITGDHSSGQFIFCDCSPESPKGRRSLCYDWEALESRKEFKPENTVIDMAAAMGIELLGESEYRALQQLGQFDCKTSSWIKTPKDVRKLGGALFADYRYGRVFIYHNSAPSYYAARGFRGLLQV